MSSKFRDLLTQARQRPLDDELGDEPTGAQEEQEEEAQGTSSTVSAPRKNSTPSLVAQSAPPASSSQSEPGPRPAASPLGEGAPEAAGASRGRPRNGKRSNPDYTQITAYITKRTHQDVKVALLREGQDRELSELVEECLRAWLQQG